VLNLQETTNDVHTSDHDVIVPHFFNQVHRRSSLMNGANHGALPNRHAEEREVAQVSEIVFAAQAGSPGAFAELYALYSRRLYRTIIAITRNSEDAEDALQETFLRAYLAIHTFEGRSAFYSWLTRIGINSALMLLRKRRARPEVLIDPQPDAPAETICFDIQDPSPTPEQVYALRHRRVTLVRAIRSLDSKLRRPIQMQITRDSSIKEIGQALKISEAAVKTRLHRARLRLSAVCQEL
jgi:RNA polymerase sigma-70 factor (ECF subfamily)